MKADRAPFSRRCNDGVTSAASHSSYANRSENSIRPQARGSIRVTPRACKRNRYTSRRRAFHVRAFRTRAISSVRSFARLRIWLINQNRQRYAGRPARGVEMRIDPRREFDGFRWLPTKHVRGFEHAFFAWTFLSFRAHLSSPATRTIDIFVSPCLVEIFAFSCDDDHAWWLFFGRVLLAECQPLEFMPVCFFRLIVSREVRTSHRGVISIVYGEVRRLVRNS